ncbi:MAG: hypothetical protein RL511_1752 [Bacteroidota bacterium]|jgi:hypothetical protein
MNYCLKNMAVRENKGINTYKIRRSTKNLHRIDVDADLYAFEADVLVEGIEVL